MAPSDTRKHSSEHITRQLLRKIRRPGALEKDPLARAIRDSLNCTSVGEALELAIDRALHGKDTRLATIVRRCDVEGELTHAVAHEMHFSPRQFFRYRGEAIEAVAVELMRLVSIGRMLPSDSRSLEARRAFAIARHLLDRSGHDNANAALVWLRRALQADPGYVDAHCAVSSANILLALSSRLDAHVAFARARAALDDAARVNPRAPVLRAEQAALELWQTGDRKRVIALAEDALGSESRSARAYYAMAWVAVMQRNLDLAERWWHAAADAADGTAFACLTVAMTIPFFRQDYATAVVSARELLEIEPDNSFVLGYLAEGYNAMRRYDETVALLAPRVARGGAPPIAVAPYLYALASRGDREAARRGRAAFAGPHIMKASVDVALGDIHTALDELDLAQHEANGMMEIVSLDPVFAPLRDERRFRAMLRPSA